MAENEPKDGTPEVEPDQIFRAQVAISDFLFKYARHFGVAVVVLLVGVALWGAWSGHEKSTREEHFGAIAEIDHKMPQMDQLAQFGLAPADDPTDTQRIANVRRGAELYEERARAASGSTAAFAWLKAAETWERLHEGEKRLAALSSAHGAGGEDMVGLAAASSYATALLDAGKVDEGIAVLRGYATSAKGFYAEEALLALAAAQVQAGKATEAQAVVEEFKRRFADSPRVARLAALVPAAAGTAPAGTPPAGAPATPPTGG